METVRLPIDEVLPDLLAALAARPCAVLAAPPGAGKTTRVPLALLGAPWATGRIVMLEPRRIAARAAAERLAEQLGERPGERVGYRIRGETRVSAATRIEVVTEGVLTRMLQRDPSLEGISAVLFDEVHERSLTSDLGLALALEVQEALRPELRIVAMSATLDTARFATLLGGAPVVESAGRLFPVTTRWLEAPLAGSRGRAPRLEDATAELVAHAHGETDTGDLLVFLPGAGEIRRTAARLGELLPGVGVVPLYGALPFAAQRAALRADPEGRRRIVLATAIAETSLTVEGVRIVVDAGKARRAQVHPATGLSRLVTVPVSRAEADQRRGRAGRLGPGVCYRLWTEAQEGALPAFAPPEILEADLAPLALELAVWGAAAEDLRFLDAPPGPALAEARALLSDLGALDGAGRATVHGHRLAARPLHPRLAHMLESAAADGLGAEAALLAALLADRDPCPEAGTADLRRRFEALAGREAVGDRGALERIRAEARRLHPGRADPARADRSGVILARAYPDRVGLRREGQAPRYLLSGGRGAVAADGDPLGAERLIVAADLDDRGTEARIRLAAPLSEADLRTAFPARIVEERSAEWTRRTARVEARIRERFGRIALSDRIWREAPPDALGRALADGIRDRGITALPGSDAALRLRGRIAWLRAQEGAFAEGLPDWSDAELCATLDTWLTPHLAGLTRIEQAARLDLHEILRSSLDWSLAREIDAAAPPHYETPLGGRTPINYAGEIPRIALRVQELFGVTRHPTAGRPPVALLIDLLSPAGRPVQTTRDLPGFWTGSYPEVAKEMRARYPKHPWPDAPWEAAPTRRTKTR